MKKCLVFASLSLVIMVASAAFALNPAPNFTMIDALSAEDKAYLGVESDMFKLSDIQAEYVFVQAFSMYCPICQRDALQLNKVFDVFAHNGNIKFIGVGLGNNPFEVSVYKKKFDVKFPLASDKDYAIHKALGEVGTPTYYLVKINGDKVETLYMEQGETKDTKALVELIRQQTGM